MLILPARRTQERRTLVLEGIMAPEYPAPWIETVYTL